MSLGQFQYPPCWSLHFWKKRLGYVSSSGKKVRFGTLCHSSIQKTPLQLTFLHPPGPVFIFIEKKKRVFLGCFWPVFPIQITMATTIICIGKTGHNRQNTPIFSPIKTKTRHSGWQLNVILSQLKAFAYILSPFEALLQPWDPR